MAVTTPGPLEEQAMRVWRAVRSEFPRPATEEQLKQVNAIADAVVTAIFAEQLSAQAHAA